MTIDLALGRRRIPGNAVAQTSAGSVLICWCTCENGVYRLHGRLLVTGQMLLPRTVTRVPAVDKSVVDTNTASAYEYGWHINPAIDAVRRLVEPAEANTYSTEAESNGKCGELRRKAPDVFSRELRRTQTVENSGRRP